MAMAKGFMAQPAERLPMGQPLSPTLRIPPPPGNTCLCHNWSPSALHHTAAGRQAGAWPSAIGPDSLFCVTCANDSPVGLLSSPTWGLVGSPDSSLHSASSPERSVVDTYSPVRSCLGLPNLSDQDGEGVQGQRVQLSEEEGERRATPFLCLKKDEVWRTVLLETVDSCQLVPPTTSANVGECPLLSLKKDEVWRTLLLESIDGSQLVPLAYEAPRYTPADQPIRTCCCHACTQRVSRAPTGPASRLPQLPHLPSLPLRSRGSSSKPPRPRAMIRQMEAPQQNTWNDVREGTGAAQRGMSTTGSGYGADPAMPAAPVEEFWGQRHTSMEVDYCESGAPKAPQAEVSAAHLRGQSRKGGALSVRKAGPPWGQTLRKLVNILEAAKHTKDDSSDAYGCGSSFTAVQEGNGGVDIRWSRSKSTDA